MRRILERRADRDDDPLSGGRLLVVGSDRDRRSLLDQALDDHPGHLADVGEHLLARGAPGGGAVGQQGGAVGVPHPLLGRLDGGREGVGAEFPAHGASITPPPTTEGRKVVSRPSYAPARRQTPGYRWLRSARARLALTSLARPRLLPARSEPTRAARSPGIRGWAGPGAPCRPAGRRGGVVRGVLPFQVRAAQD